MDERLTRQIAFALELDRLKLVERGTVVGDRSRHENSAEHSWHLAVLTAVLAEHAAQPFDLGRALLMALLHDVVEIDAGDTFAYGPSGHEDKEAREQAAAERLYGLLPAEQAGRLADLWREFEAGESPAARFVRAMDRLQPVLLHRLTGGAVWREHGVRRDQVLRRVGEIQAAAPVLWPLVEQIMDEAAATGALTVK